MVIGHVVELVDTPSWGGGGVSRPGSSPGVATIEVNRKCGQHAGRFLIFGSICGFQLNIFYLIDWP